MASESVTGRWFGNYYYADMSQSHGFEAVFAQSGNTVEGSILDDGQLGEAHVSGTCAGSELTFCKIYNSKAQHPVTYNGTLSEDGKSISGKWRINESVNGNWTAWRMDDEAVPETTETETESEMEEQRELVPVPQVRPSKQK